MARILVTAASRYGATEEIAAVIADALTTAGHDVSLTPCAEVAGVEGFDAVIVGSAVYVGHWLRAATTFVETQASALKGRPVWMFSSGPVGDPPKPDEDPVDVAALAALIEPREHRVFSGRLDKSGMRFADKAIITALRAPVGDFRDWDAVGAWARPIADELSG